MNQAVLQKVEASQAFPQARIFEQQHLLNKGKEEEVKLGTAARTECQMRGRTCVLNGGPALAGENGGTSRSPLRIRRGWRGCMLEDVGIDVGTSAFSSSSIFAVGKRKKN